MVGGDKRGKNAAAASGAEKQNYFYDDVMQVLSIAPPFFFSSL